MATSGESDFKQNVTDLISDALVEAGVLDAEYRRATEGQLTTAKRALNRMVKAWQTEPGVNLWVRTQGEMTVVAGQLEYQMGGGGAPDFAARPLGIEEMRLVYSDGRELLMTRYSYSEYQDLPQKDATGTSTIWSLDLQRDDARVHVWPVLGSVDGEKLRFTYHRRIEDLDSMDDDFDFPSEWGEALLYGLAYRMVRIFRQSDTGKIREAKAMADEAFNTAKDYDVEDASVYIMPDTRGMGWG